jgi:hypothetical protein
MAEPKFEIGDRVKYLVKANQIREGHTVDLYDVVKILGFYKPPELDPQELEELDPQELQKQRDKKYYETDGGVKEVEKIDLTGEKVPKNAKINRVVYKRTNRRNRTRKNRTRKNRTRKLR